VTDDGTVRYAVNVDLVWIPDPRLADRYGRLLLRRTVHPRWPGLDGAPVTGFWISDPIPEDALLQGEPTSNDTWGRVVLGQPVTAVASPVTMHPPTDGDRRDLRALLGRPTPADHPSPPSATHQPFQPSPPSATNQPFQPERTTRPLLEIDVTVRVTSTDATVERARVGRAVADVLTHPLRPVFDRPLGALIRSAGHPGTPVPAGGHERSSRRSHWYREAELTRAVFADLELRDAISEPDDVTIARFAAAGPGDLGEVFQPDRVPEGWTFHPDPLDVRAAGAFGRFLRGLVVIVTATDTHLMTRAPSGSALLHETDTARALASTLAQRGGDPDVVTLAGGLRAIADDLPMDWKDGRGLDLDPAGPVTVVRIPH
jgi:hypothetical protein